VIFISNSLNNLRYFIGSHLVDKYHYAVFNGNKNYNQTATQEGENS